MTETNFNIHTVILAYINGQVTIEQCIRSIRKLIAEEIISKED
jgi:hypothetical protein